MEVNAVKKGECRAEDGAKGGTWVWKRSSERVFEESGVRVQRQHHSGALYVLPEGLWTLLAVKVGVWVCLLWVTLLSSAS